VYFFLHIYYRSRVVFSLYNLVWHCDKKIWQYVSDNMSNITDKM